MSTTPTPRIDALSMLVHMCSKRLPSRPMETVVAWLKTNGVTAGKSPRLWQNAMPPLSWRKEMNILMSSFLATGLFLVGGVFGRWQKSPPDLDQQVLDQLKKAGSNLSKPHDIEFFLYFQTKESA